MVGPQFPDRVRIHGTLCIHLFQCADPAIFQHLHKSDKNLRRTGCVIYRAVMMSERYLHRFGDCLQFEPGELRQQILLQYMLRFWNCQHYS